MENPLATMTLMAVIRDAMRMALSEEEGVVKGRGSGTKMDDRTFSRQKGDTRTRTRQIFCEQCERIRSVRHSKNRTKGSAVDVGSGIHLACRLGQARQPPISVYVYRLRETNVGVIMWQC